MSKERIINLGFGNFVVASRVVGIINPASSPMRRLREDARTEGRLWTPPKAGKPVPSS